MSAAGPPQGARPLGGEERSDARGDHTSATIATIKEIIAKLKGTPALASELSDSADLLRDVGLDSLELLQFMLDAEERLAIRIDFNSLEYSTLQSIFELARFFETMPPRDSPLSTA